MAEVFKNAKLILTTSADIVYTCPPDTAGIILLSQVANVDGINEANVDVSWIDVSDSDAETHLVKGAPIPAGGALNVIGGKMVLETGDGIKAVVSANDDLEITISVLEIS